MRYSAVLLITAALLMTGSAAARAQGPTATVTVAGHYPPYSGANVPGIIENGAYVIQGIDGNLFGTTSDGGTSNLGTLFEMTTAGSVTILHSFAGGADGAHPLSPPLQTSDGAIYGTTTGEGDHDGASVYVLSPSGGFSTLYSFAPNAGNVRIILGSDGNLYGVTEESDTIFQLTPAGALTTLYSATGSSDVISNILQGTDGNFYGYTTSSIFELTPGGTFTTLHELSDPPDGQRISSLIQGTDGNLYGTTAGGGATATPTTYPAGTVFRITTAGVYTVLYTFLLPANPMAQPEPTAPSGLLQGSDGNFYGWTVGPGYASGGGGALFQMTPSGDVTPLYALSPNDDVGFYCLSLIQAADGTFYGTTEFHGQGTAGEGVVFHAVVHAATPPTVPPTPAHVEATAGDAAVRLSWSASAGATSYSVYRGTTSGGETVYQSGLVQTTFRDTGLTNGVTYYYTVAAANSAGTSTPSMEVSATPAAPGSPPPPPPPNALQSFAPGLQMISGPVDDSAFTLAQIFDISNVTLAVWDPSGSAYVLSPNSPANTIVAGQGYWVRFATTADLLVAGPETDLTQAVDIPLSAGWNMIGDPFATAASMTGVTFGAGSGNAVSAGDAVSSGLIGPRVYTYQPGDTQYEAQPAGSATLATFQGYWIYAGQACTMIFPGTGGSAPPPPPL